MRNQIVGAEIGESVVTEATTIGFYLIYASVAVGLVVFLARVLSRNGQIFLEEAFEREELASSVNQLLVIGFYLLNLGYALLVYRVSDHHASVIAAFNDLMTNLGILLASLGVLHLINMGVLWRIGGRMLRRRTSDDAPAPYASVTPPGWTPPPPSPAAVATSAPTGRYPDYEMGPISPADQA